MSKPVIVHSFTPASGPTRKFTAEEIAEIMENAKVLAKNAAERKYAIVGDSWPCGFAWIDIKIRSNSRLGKELHKHGFSPSYQRGVLQLWNPSTLHVQNMDVLAAGAETAAEYLTSQLGLPFNAGRRMD